MTEKEKAKAYDKAIERAKKLYDNGITEEIFPELYESEDEMIKTAILNLLKIWRNYKDYVCGVHVEDAIAWLEKQGEQNPCMIQWKGDNLKEVIGFTGKDKNFEKWFKSFEEYEKYVHEHNDIFKLFNENGNHYEIPVGAWIVKTPDGYNIASNAVLKQKSANKIEPTFNVDDWVVNKFGDSWHIDSLDKKNYQVSNGKGNYNYFPILKHNEMHIWTIQDAKDGDIIRLGTVTAIFKKYISQEKCICYCSFCKNAGFEIPIENGEDNVYGCYNATPTTKEQRDSFMKVMNDAGYEWDIEKKELKKKRKR